MREEGHKKQFEDKRRFNIGEGSCQRRQCGIEPVNVEAYGLVYECLIES